MQASNNNNILYNYSLGAVALILGAVPDGSGQIWLDNVQCRGTETRLIDCPRNALGSHNCAHFEDAGVRCVAGEWCLLRCECTDSYTS